MIMPDVNVVDEIKKHSFILHFFRKCYAYYLKRCIETSTKSNREIQQDYWDREGYSHHTSKDLQIEWYNTPFQKKFYEFLDTFCGGKTILDIGCGSFFILKKCRIFIHHLQ